MKVKCIQTKATYYAIFFEKGSYYETSEIVTYNKHVISDHLAYMNALRRVLEISEPLRSLQKDAEAFDKMAKSLNYPEMMKQPDIYKKEVSIPFYKIVGDAGFQYNKSHDFCILSKKEVSDLYGSQHFDTSMDYFEDYFISIEEIRDEKINKILEQIK